MNTLPTLRSVKVPFIAQVESSGSPGDEKFQNLPCCTGKYPVNTSAIAWPDMRTAMRLHTAIIPIILFQCM
jgi:hypothetical protein